MTVGQILHLVTKNGFSLYCRPDGTPVVKPRTLDAFLPNDVQQLLIDNRQAIVDWFFKNHRREWEKCAVCKADVHQSMTPQDAERLCDRVETKKTLHCPYKDPVS